MKAQLKIQQMIFMILAVILLFGLIIIFLVTFLNKTISSGADDVAELRAKGAVERLAGSAEFGHSDLSLTRAIDLKKALVISLMRDSYSEYWKEYSSIRIIRESGLKKSIKDSVQCNFGNINFCDELVILDRNVNNTQEYASYILICDEKLEMGNYFDDCEIGKMIVGVELKDV